MTVSRNSAVLDRIGRPFNYLRIAVTDRCNFRCPYCMPAEVFGEDYAFLPGGTILTFEEMERLARIFAGMGVEKIRVTGGEPLVRSELPKLVRLLAGIGEITDLALTTNGYLLAEHAQTLKDAGLNRITVSLDSLDDGVFNRMSGRNHGTRRVLEGIDAAGKAGLSPIKVNCMVQRGMNDHTVVDLVRHFKGTGVIVRFIEYMDVGTANGWNLKDVVPGADVVRMIDAEIPLEPVDPNYRGEVASRYAFKDGTGEIGIVASVSSPFCGDCSRVRLSTSGTMITCLFAGGGTDLCGPMRAGATDEDLREIIAATWAAREDRYSELRSAETDDGPGGPPRRIEMFRIGG